MKIDRFTSGVVCMACSMSLIQDFYGLDGYVERLRNNWIDGIYTIPIAIIVGIITLKYTENR